MIKAIRARDSTFECLSSYILTTALFYSSDVFPLRSDWKRNRLGENVLRLLLRLEQAMDEGRLDNHSIPGLNLLSNLDDGTMEQLRNRLHRLTSDREEFLTLLTK